MNETAGADQRQKPIGRPEARPKARHENIGVQDDPMSHIGIICDTARKPKLCRFRVRLDSMTSAAVHG